MAIEKVLLGILYIINISQMSHYGYYMMNSFNKYLLMLYYMPGGKFNESVTNPEFKPNVTVPYNW